MRLFCAQALANVRVLVWGACQAAGCWSRFRWPLLRMLMPLPDQGCVLLFRQNPPRHFI